MGFEIKNGILTNYIEEPDVTEIIIPEEVTAIGLPARQGGALRLFTGGPKSLLYDVPKSADCPAAFLL